MGFLKVVKTIAGEGREDRASHTAAKVAKMRARGQLAERRANARKTRAEARALETHAKAEKIRAQGEKRRAGQSAARTRARAAAVATSVSSSSQSLANALGQWNSVINSSAEPAEGTGAAQPGTSGGNTTGSPIGGAGQ